jgi:putative Holliday junction resolvase
MRYLGIDYGEKRIGLALSDPEGCLAFPHDTVGNIGDVVAAAKREGVGKIVVGLPISFGGGESHQAEQIRQFAAELESRVELPIVFENEVFTSKIAEKMSPSEKADASAAALILQSYLDRQQVK